MTTLKFQAKLGANASQAMMPHAGPLYARLGSHRLAVMELRSAERTDVADGEDKEPAVLVKVTHLEVANAEQEETLRGVLRALHMQRTAYGTLTEDGDLQLAESTLERAAGEVNAIEAARLNAAIDAWVEYGRRVLSRAKVTASELRTEMDTMLRGLKGAVDPSLRKD